MSSRVLSITTFVALAIAVGCRRESPVDDRGQGKVVRQVSPTVAPEPWMKKPTRDWPQLVLTNQADFHGHSSLEGASSFLIRTQDGRILAATAKHLIGENGGVDPEIPLEELSRAIRSWRLFPRTMPQNAVAADGLGSEHLDDENLDWLILTLKNPAEPLPALPLRLRREPIEVGEKVFLVGCSYDEPACKQNVYVGTVTARDGDRFRYDIDPPVNIRGFSGAPILDGDGRVAGVMTVWFEPKMREEMYLEAGGEDSASIYHFVDNGR